ncbi:MAG TPA: hypothetical protein QGI62_09260 [Anaerolineales bacterium]|jgi:hypothetical protein|nr:hypothetical protein [Anaerolineales bacterium]
MGRIWFGVGRHFRDGWANNGVRVYFNKSCHIIPHMAASWPTLGAKVGQVTLQFGCDDFGLTMIEENVISVAGAPTRVSPMMSVVEIHRQIRETEFFSAQCDSSYNILREYRAAAYDDDLPEVSLENIPEFVPLPWKTAAA